MNFGDLCKDANVQEKWVGSKIEIASRGNSNIKERIQSQIRGSKWDGINSLSNNIDSPFFSTRGSPNCAIASIPKSPISVEFSSFHDVWNRVAIEEEGCMEQKKGKQPISNTFIPRRALSRSAIFEARLLLLPSGVYRPQIGKPSARPKFGIEKSKKK